MRDRLIRHGLPLAMLAAVLSGGAAGLVTARPFKPVAAPSAEGLPSFGSEEAFHRFMTERRAVVEARRRLAAMRYSDEAVSAMIVPLEQATESITNTQEVGVDEGGIVKASGDHLVVLRRGRLFTFSIAGGGLRAIDRIDVPPPGREASEEESWDATWYDEM
ncbi:MAG: beta-propeller domain-containing protein, partial [Brevundimonas sp.]|nr:beta-propeller domain-containing protein [Brevundimonas sp.]